MLVAMSEAPNGIENAKLLYNMSGGNSLGYFGYLGAGKGRPTPGGGGRPSPGVVPQTQAGMPPVPTVPRYVAPAPAQYRPLQVTGPTAAPSAAGFAAKMAAAASQYIPSTNVFSSPETTGAYAYVPSAADLAAKFATAAGGSPQQIAQAARSFAASGSSQSSPASTPGKGSARMLQRQRLKGLGYFGYLGSDESDAKTLLEAYRNHPKLVNLAIYKQYWPVIGRLMAKGDYKNALVYLRWLGSRGGVTAVPPAVAAPAAAAPSTKTSIKAGIEAGGGLIKDLATAIATVMGKTQTVEPPAPDGGGPVKPETDLTKYALIGGGILLAGAVVFAVIKSAKGKKGKGRK